METCRATWATSSTASRPLTLKNCFPSVKSEHSGFVSVVFHPSVGHLAKELCLPKKLVAGIERPY